MFGHSGVTGRGAYKGKEVVEVAVWFDEHNLELSTGFTSKSICRNSTYTMCRWQDIRQLLGCGLGSSVSNYTPSLTLRPNSPIPRKTLQQRQHFSVRCSSCSLSRPEEHSQPQTLSVKQPSFLSGVKYHISSENTSENTPLPSVRHDKARFIHAACRSGTLMARGIPLAGCQGQPGWGSDLGDNCGLWAGLPAVEPAGEVKDGS